MGKRNIKKSVFVVSFVWMKFLCRRYRRTSSGLFNLNKSNSFEKSINIHVSRYEYIGGMCCLRKHLIISIQI